MSVPRREPEILAPRARDRAAPTQPEELLRWFQTLCTEIELGFASLPDRITQRYLEANHAGWAEEPGEPRAYLEAA